MKKLAFVMGLLFSALCVNALANNNDAVTFASLDASVRSDQSSFVKATITDGKYKGAKLIGHIVMVKKVAGEQSGIGLSFTEMHLKKTTKPIAIAAYAIDPDTARTAIKSGVSADYLHRHATVLATSFIQSYQNEPLKSGYVIGLVFMPNKT